MIKRAKNNSITKNIDGGEEIMDEKLMDNEQRQELFKAISKLSAEDQEKIAAGGVITDKQCEELQDIVQNSEFRRPIAARYGGRIPHYRPSKVEQISADDNVTKLSDGAVNVSGQI